MLIHSDFSPIIEKEWEINFTQCASNGYLRYTDLCHLLQLIASNHAELGGISFNDMQKFNQAWVLSQMLIEIKSLPRWKSKVIIKTWITSFENSRSIRSIEIYYKGKKIVGAETLWVVFNTKTRRPEQLALPFNHFHIYPNKRATKKEVSRVDLTEKPKITFDKTVYLSDLDIVNHVNNVKYLEWCLDYENEKRILNQKIKSLKMNFLKELSLKDKIQLNLSHNSNLDSTTPKTTFYSITKENKLSFAMQLEWEED